MRNALKELPPANKISCPDQRIDIERPSILGRILFPTTGKTLRSGTILVLSPSSAFCCHTFCL